MRGIDWSLVNSPHKSQRRGALMFFILVGGFLGSVFLVGFVYKNVTN